MGNQLAPRPLLIIGGGQDRIAPASHIEAFHDGIAPAYRRAGAVQNLKYLELDDVAHRFDGRQVDAMLEWFDRHLSQPSPATKPRRRKTAKAHD